MRSIRIFSRRGENGEYAAGDWQATASVEEGIGGEKGGVRRRSQASIRIMTAEEIGVSAGDYVSFGKNSAPDKNADLMITAVKDNRRGNLPHWRLTVSGVRHR